MEKKKLRGKSVDQIEVLGTDPNALKFTTGNEELQPLRAAA